jgi:hypothetical protein
VIQNCIVVKVKLGKTISTAHALLHNQHVGFVMANPVQLIHATVMKLVAYRITTLVILFIALVIQDIIAVLQIMTLGSPTLSDVNAIQIFIAAHNKLGDKTQKTAHLAIQTLSVAMNSTIGKTTTANALAPKNAALMMTTIPTQSSVPVIVKRNAV